LERDGPPEIDLARRSTAWRPWRGYAALHMPRGAGRT
jgi:3-methyladenine DNA glycosylase/8-oxoguanine DNA glycosylase